MQIHTKSTTYRLQIHTEVPVAVISVPKVFSVPFRILHNYFLPYHFQLVLYKNLLT